MILRSALTAAKKSHILRCFTSNIPTQEEAEAAQTYRKNLLKVAEYLNYELYQDSKLLGYKISVNLDTLNADNPYEEGTGNHNHHLVNQSM